MDLIERAAKQHKPKKKKKSVSLVERAAETVEKSPFAGKAVGIGVPKKLDASPKRDPSAMNPSVVDAPSAGTVSKAKSLGIGTPRKAGDPKKVAKSGVATTENHAKGLNAGVGEPTYSVGVGVTGQDNTTGKPKERPARKRRPVEEVDLTALREGGYITPDMPPNLMLEEFRIIKRSILLNAFSKGVQKSKNSNIILVTSSNPGEGKTFCTINLALSIATEQDTTVLLIDADFSKPEVLNRLGVAGGRGLMDVVADKDLEIGDCLIRTSVPNLVLLPAGRQHNLTTELLASDRMETIVDEIANRYPDRLVIFDSPPVLASSAASVMALYMGQTVFVIHAEKTTEPQIKESLNMISSCEHINLLLNQTRFSGSNKKFATYYGYGGR